VRQPEKQGLGQKQMKGRTSGKNHNEINYLNTISQITKNTAWTKSLPVDETAFLDSAASLHLLHNRAPAKKNRNTRQAEKVTIPNGTNMHTTETIELKIDNLPKNAKIGHRLPGIVNNLVAAPILCDAGCEVKFTKTDVTVTKNNEILLTGWRDPTKILWRVPLVQSENSTKIQQIKIITTS
jgi:hypothetical protein